MDVSERFTDTWVKMPNDLLSTSGWREQGAGRAFK
jgi:hypothetical protein